MYISDKTDLSFLASELNLSKEETICFANKIIKKIHKSRSKKSMNVFANFIKKKAMEEGTVTEEVTDSKEKVVIYKIEVDGNSLITKTLAVVGGFSIGSFISKTVYTAIKKKCDTKKEIQIKPLKTETTPVSKVKHVGKVTKIKK